MEPDEYNKLLAVKRDEVDQALKDQMYGLLFMPPKEVFRIPSAEWFATHPMQRRIVFVTREPRPGDRESYAVEVWKDGARIHAQCGAGNSASFIPGPMSKKKDSVFDSRLAGLIDQVVDGYIARAKQAAGIIDNEEEPTPQGVGWDDFDWSI